MTTQQTSTPDTGALMIKRVIELSAPIHQVWLALTDHEQFGDWFKVRLDSPFQVGKVSAGEVTYPGYEGMKFWARPEVMDSPTCFQFIWPIEETTSPDDPHLMSKTTHVEFCLSEQDTGTTLTLCESGFEKLYEEIRDRAFAQNSEGWDAQMGNIEQYLRQKISNP